MPDPESPPDERETLIWTLRKDREIASCYLGFEDGVSVVRVQMELPDVLVTILQPGLGERDEVPVANSWLAMFVDRGWMPAARPMTILPKPDRRQSKEPGRHPAPDRMYRGLATFPSSVNSASG